MKSSWNQSVLSDLAIIVGRGITPKYSDSGDCLVINQRCIRGGRVTLDHARLHDSRLKAIKDVKQLVHGDILVNSTGMGTLGRTAPWRCTGSFRVTVDSHVTIVRPKASAHPRWLAYSLSAVEPLIESLAHGSTGQTELAASSLAEIRLLCPPSATQQRIANLLGALDDKIDSNRSASQMLNSLSNLLAEKMLHSGPTQTVPLSKLANFNTKNIRRDQFNEIEYVDIKGTGQGHIDSTIRFDATSAPSRARRLVSDGDVIYSTVRPNRQVYSPIFSPPPNLVVSTGFAVATPTNIAGTSFISYIFQQNSFSQYLSASASGSAYPAASIGSISSYPVVIPTDISKLKSYESSTQRMRRLAMTLHQQDRRLAELRDTLLPELMSGRMRVDEAGHLIADALGKESVDD